LPSSGTPAIDDYLQPQFGALPAAFTAGRQQSQAQLSRQSQTSRQQHTSQQSQHGAAAPHTLNSEARTKLNMAKTPVNDEWKENGGPLATHGVPVGCAHHNSREQKIVGGAHGQCRVGSAHHIGSMVGTAHPIRD
jgi:hypothetical protein